CGGNPWGSRKLLNHTENSPSCQGWDGVVTEIEVWNNGGEGGIRPCSLGSQPCARPLGRARASGPTECHWHSEFSSHTSKRTPASTFGRVRLPCGEGGIRTHETVSRPHAFQACALSHSATSPGHPKYSRAVWQAKERGLHKEMVHDNREIS